MKNKIIMALMGMLFEEIINFATKEGLYKKAVDGVCDFAERMAHDSDNDLFKKVVGRISGAIRSQLDVPDDDDITPDTLLNH
jgi:hypothetical protein